MATNQFTREDFNQFISTLKYPPNPFQQEILESIAFGQGNIQVSAVAGSGKTTMIEMIVKLVRYMETVTQSPAMKLFAMAFNVTIREELSKRLSPYGVNVDNSNRLGNTVIKKHLEDLGEKAPKVDPNKYQDLASRVLSDVIGRQFETVERDDDGQPIMKSTWALKYGIASLAEKCLTAFVQPDNIDAMWWLAEHHSFDFKGAIEDVEIQVIEEVLPKLLREGRRLWEDHRIISLSEQLALPISEYMVFPKYQIVLVDEGQDLNIAQQAIAKRCIAEGGRIVIVGDARQAIMGFSGADDAAWWRMQKVYNTKLYALNITYRCPTKVADLARAIVPQLEARPNAPEGTIRQNISKLDFYSLLKPDTLILSRMNKDLVETFFELVKEKAKRNDKLTIQVIGRDISNALTEILKRIEKLHGFKYEDLGLYVDRYIQMEEERIKKLRSETRREEQRDKLHDEIATLMMCHENFACKTLEDFKTKISSVFGGGDENEELKRRNDLHSVVSLCTAHKSKGLEAERIIILAPEKMPLEREGQHPWQLVQEMNLLYVAITRSLSELIVIEGFLNVSPVAYDAEAAAHASSDERRFAALALENDSIPGVNVDKILGIASITTLTEEPVEQSVPEATIEEDESKETSTVSMGATDIEALEVMDSRLQKAHDNLKRAIRYLRSASTATEERDRKDYLLSAESYCKDFDVETSKLNLPWDEKVALMGEEGNRLFTFNSLHSRVYNLLGDSTNLIEAHNLAVSVLKSFSKANSLKTAEVAQFPTLSIEEADKALYAPSSAEEYFVYGATRPILYGTCPDGYVMDRNTIVAALKACENDFYPDTVVYSRKLTRKEMKDYELHPMSLNAWDVQVGETVMTTTAMQWTVTKHLKAGKLLLEIQVDGRKEVQVEHQWDVTPVTAIATSLAPKPETLNKTANPESNDSPQGEKVTEAAPVVSETIPTDPVAWAKWMMANKGHVVILDTETTDFQTNPGNFEMVQLGLINLDGEEVLNRFIVPYVSRITEGATAVHGITHALLSEKGASSLITQYEDVKAALTGKIVVAYNSPFDKAALENSLKLCGLTPIEIGSWHCAMRMYTKHNPNKADKRGKLGTNWKLAEALVQQGLTPDENAHDALADVRMTLALIQSMAADSPERWQTPKALPAPTERPYQVDDLVKVKASGKDAEVKKLMPNEELSLALLEDGSRLSLNKGMVTLLKKAEDRSKAKETPPAPVESEEETNARLDVRSMDLNGKQVRLDDGTQAEVIAVDGKQLTVQPENAEAPIEVSRDELFSVITTEVPKAAQPEPTPVPVVTIPAKPKQANPYTELERLMRSFKTREAAEEFIELLKETVEEVFPETA